MSSDDRRLSLLTNNGGEAGKSTMSIATKPENIVSISQFFSRIDLSHPVEDHFERQIVCLAHF